MVGYHGALVSAATHDRSPLTRLGFPTSGPLAACTLAGTDGVGVARGRLLPRFGPDSEQAARITTAAIINAIHQKRRELFICAPPLMAGCPGPTIVSVTDIPKIA